MSFLCSMNATVHRLNELHAEATAVVADLRAKARRLSALRVTAFLASATLLVLGIRDYAFIEMYGFWLVSGAALVFALFLAAVRMHANTDVRYQRALGYLKAIGNELKVAAGDFSGMDAGAAPPAGHPWADDLGLFGEWSLHRAVSRCHTVPGKQAFRELLLTAPVRADQRGHHHAAVQALADAREERLRFVGAASLVDAEARAWEAFHAFARPNAVSAPGGGEVKLLLLLVPLFSVTVLVLGFGGWMNSSVALGLLTLPLVVSGVYFRKTAAVYAAINPVIGFMDGLAFLTERGAALPAEPRLLAHDIRTLHEAQEAARQLARIGAAYDQRNNLFAAIVTNAIYLAELRNAVRVVRWHREHAHRIVEWSAAIARLEMSVSLASFYDLHRLKLVFPSSGEADTIQGEKLLHPLMLDTAAVANPFSFGAAGRVMLITGANMAGKSTYLRVIGLNVLLAQIGAPVAAQGMVVGDVRLFTSMKTSDSLASGTSYFMAELRRLSELVALENHEPPVLALLDEILKGTNSADKEAGSRAFVEKLLRIGIRAVVATHDVSLCTLANDHPERVLNRYFAADTGNDDLTFDYRLRDGVCDTMNATWLMKKMGIVD